MNRSGRATVQGVREIAARINCDNQVLTLHAVLSEGVATVRQTRATGEQTAQA
jgi:hypothetical protein